MTFTVLVLFSQVEVVDGVTLRSCHGLGNLFLKEQKGVNLAIRQEPLFSGTSMVALVVVEVHVHLVEEEVDT